MQPKTHFVCDRGVNDEAVRRKNSEELVTEVLELDDGTTVTAAARPANRLYYSDDGLVWQPVADSPTFQKPLLIADDAGGALVLDEYQAEDDSTETQRSTGSTQTEPALCGAGGGTRTRTPLRAMDFESIAYTNFATPAWRRSL